MRSVIEKKGVSPVIATVILIGIVLTIAVIVFVWIKGMREDVITKFGDANIQQACRDTSFDAEYTSSDEELSVANNGNVAIYRMSVKVFSDGSYETVSLSDFESLNPGATYVGELTEASDAEKIILIPVLLGTSENGQEAYVCEEEFGKELVI